MVPQLFEFMVSGSLGRGMSEGKPYSRVSAAGRSQSILRSNFVRAAPYNLGRGSVRVPSNVLQGRHTVDLVFDCLGTS